MSSAYLSRPVLSAMPSLWETRIALKKQLARRPALLAPAPACLKGARFQQRVAQSSAAPVSRVGAVATPARRLVTAPWRQNQYEGAGSMGTRLRSPRRAPFHGEHVCDGSRAPLCDGAPLSDDDDVMSLHHSCGRVLGPDSDDDIISINRSCDWPGLNALSSGRKGAVQSTTLVSTNRIRDSGKSPSVVRAWV